MGAVESVIRVGAAQGDPPDPQGHASRFREWCGVKVGRKAAFYKSPGGSRRGQKTLRGRHEGVAGGARRETRP